jgi:diguanylate cyclase (GGDEF)-like protein/PAS domain S-box-containing protein
MNSKSPLYQLLSHIHEPVVVFNVKGAIVTCNESFANTVSLPKDTLLQMTVHDVFANATVLLDAMNAQKDAEPVTIAQLKIKNNDVELNGTLTRIEDAFCFIAQQKEDDIHRHFALLQTILNAIPPMIVVLDEAGNIVMANREWIAFISNVVQKPVDYDDYKQKNLFMFCEELQCFDQTLHNILHESVVKVLNNQSQTISFEHTLRVGDGSNWYRFVISRYTLNGYVYCVLMINDISEQKQYLDKIQEQRDTFQKYLDISPYMMVVINTEGKITLVNKMACKILGYTEEELLGKDWFSTCLPSEIQEEVRSVFKKIIQGDVKPVEFYENPVVTKDGELRLIAWHNSIVTDVQGNIIASISSGEDVTKQKQMEIELLKSSANLKAIVKAFPDLYVIADKDGVIYDYQFGEEMKLFAPSENVIGKNFKDVLPEHIAALYENALKETFATGKVVGIEYPIVVEGQEHWREARLVPMMKDRLMVVIRDVTQRKQTELALADSERRYRHLVNRIPAAVVEMNVQGEIIFVNDYFTALTGFTLQDVQGTQWFRNILHPHEDKKKIRQFVNLMEQGDVSNFEFRILNKQGKEAIISITTSNIRNVVGKLERIICIGNDITPIVEMREKLKEMAIKDELTGLYNRRGFVMLAEQQLKLNKRSGKGSALFYVDMDNMKAINDTMGHHEGDKALIDVAGILRLSFRDSDIIARLGGDEFAVLAIDCEHQYVDMMQQRLVDNINEFNAKSLRQYTVSLSIGCVFISDSSLDLNEIIVLADSKMYKNKLERKKQRM